MANDVAISVRGLSKAYSIAQGGLKRPNFRELVIDRVKHPFQRTKMETFWALKDVRFDVKKGDVVGIIGRNGAGKSTLLKIMSRIVEPTEGEIDLYGRVGSLLEVGTGFHGELTGRENIYLNGAILGMKREEIRKHFDEIVDFAEVEKFLDTPVKRYSSGMYVRLAFAVAAHLNPEILIVDEVLAVGDSEFQKKCLGKMGDVAKGGRTVLFVSHNMAAVTALCKRAILLAKGRVVHDGDVEDIVGEYVRMFKTTGGAVRWDNPPEAPGNEHIRLHSVRTLSGGEATADVNIDEDIHIEIEFWNRDPGAMLCTSIHLLDQMGTCVLASANNHEANLTRDHWFGKPAPPGLFRATCTIPANLLNEGGYQITAIVLTQARGIEVFAKEIISFTVHETGAMRGGSTGPWIGQVRPRIATQTELLKEGAATLREATV